MSVLRSARRSSRALLVVPAVLLLTAPPSDATTAPADWLDQAPGTTRIISKRTDGTLVTEVTGDPSISGTGRYVAFYSEDRKLLDDPLPCCQIYLRDRSTGVTELVSVNEAGEPAGRGANSPSLSHDGRELAFWSTARNLVEDRTRGHRNVYVRDNDTGELTLITKGRNGRPANGDSFNPSISADGTRIAFLSDASNLAKRDENMTTDVFVHDLKTGETTLISRGTDGKSALGQSLQPSISADGTRVAYFSGAGNIVPGDTEGFDDVFVYDIARAKTWRASSNPDGDPANNGSFNPTLSGDGSMVTFWSFADDLAPQDGNAAGDVFVHVISTGETTLVSRTPDGDSGNDESDDPVFSADGSIVVYQSFATDLGPVDQNESVDVYVYALADGSTSLISRDVDGGSTDGPSLVPVPSADGSLIAFESVAGDLVPGDTNDQVDTFVHRRF